MKYRTKQDILFVDFSDNITVVLDNDARTRDLLVQFGTLIDIRIATRSPANVKVSITVHDVPLALVWKTVPSSLDDVSTLEIKSGPLLVHCEIQDTHAFIKFLRSARQLCVPEVVPDVHNHF
jgi:hypothetical protein